MDEHFNAGFLQNADPNSKTVSVRCPRCRKNGTFESIAANDVRIQNLEGAAATTVGMRRCPDPTCRSVIFFAWPDIGDRVTYPPETIDFDTTELPTPVVEALTEAVSCHAHDCYKAAAMMVRKCLEEVCLDRGAKGGNLKERVKALGKKALMPGDLFDGLDDLRLLGNDAAHVESQDYDDVGKEEIEVGITFTKEGLEGDLPVREPAGAAGRAQEAEGRRCGSVRVERGHRISGKVVAEVVAVAVVGWIIVMQDRRIGELSTNLQP